MRNLEKQGDCNKFYTKLIKGTAITLHKKMNISLLMDNSVYKKMVLQLGPHLDLS